MNISNTVKEEILSVDYKDKVAALAFLSGAMRGIGFLRPSSKGFGLAVEGGSQQLIEKSASMLSKLYSIHIDTHTYIAGGLNKSLAYRYELDWPSAQQFILDAGLVEGGIPASKIPPFVRDKDNTAASYIRGVFAACGTLSAPPAVDSLSKQTNKAIKKQGYHLEMRLTSLPIARDLLNLLNEARLQSGLIERKNYNIIYIKGGESISDFLALIGADRAVMSLQEVIISRSIRNLTNRQYNCTIANINKSLRASEAQVEAINFIDNKVSLASLPESLKETALLRLEYPYASLDELLALHTSELSKSGLNHRFRKLINIAATLKEEKE